MDRQVRENSFKIYNKYFEESDWRDCDSLDYRSLFLSLGPRLDPEHTKERFILASGKTYTPTMGASYFYDFCKLHFNKAMRPLRCPWMILNGDTDLLNTHDFTLEEIEAFQGRDHVFCFFEPLFKSDSTCQNLYNSEQYFPELEAIRQFRSKYNVQTKTTIFLCDYDHSGYLSRIYPEFSFETRDPFLYHLARSILTHGFADGIFSECFDDFDMRKLRNHLRTIDIRNQSRFFCANFRYEPFRQLVTAFVIGSEFKENSQLSFFHRYNKEILDYLLSFEVEDLKSWPVIQSGLESLDNLVPLTICVDKPEAVAPEDHTFPNEKVGTNTIDLITNRDFVKTMLKTSAIVIANESRPESYFGNISEKTLDAILTLKPFICVSGPYSLKYMKELGFKTFDEFWDESYDQCTDHRERLDRVCSLIRSLGQMNETEFTALIRNMEATVLHNFHNLMNYNMNYLKPRTRISI